LPWFSEKEKRKIGLGQRKLSRGEWPRSKRFLRSFFRAKIKIRLAFRFETRRLPWGIHDGI
jgi:hypothetical protein